MELQAGGFTVQEARELCIMLEAAGFDFVELSGGTYQYMAFEHKRESTKKREALSPEMSLDNPKGCRSLANIPDQIRFCDNVSK